MNMIPEGNAIVYCEAAFGTPNGKTAHGLVRHTYRYNVLSVIDSCHSGSDAGMVLDNKPANIPVYDSLETAFNAQKRKDQNATHFVMGLAPDGGRLDLHARETIKKAIQYGLNVDCGLHDLLSEDAEIVEMANNYNVKLRDVRKTQPRDKLHFFSGKIEDVDSLKIAVLGTDSAIGKRTTAWILVNAFEKAGYRAEFIGTGQTAWMQGARYSIILDSLINDFVAGEIEHAVWSAWNENSPDVIVVEGQGSLMNPAYPGGFEILAAARPDVIVLQHAPARVEYDGFPGYKLHPLSKQINAIEMLSDVPVAAVTINHENLSASEIRDRCKSIMKETGLPVCDILLDGADEIVNSLVSYLKGRKIGNNLC